MPSIEDIPTCACGAHDWRWTGIAFYSDPMKYEARCRVCRRTILIEEPATKSDAGHPSHAG